MCVCVCVPMCVCVHAHTCVCMCVHVRVNSCVCSPVSVCICLCVYDCNISNTTKDIHFLTMGGLYSWLFSYTGMLPIEIWSVVMGIWLMHK